MLNNEFFSALISVSNNMRFHLNLKHNKTNYSAALFENSFNCAK
jgi:hypothetical protein